MEVLQVKTCGECMYAELECPPIVICRLTGETCYMDSPACKKFRKLQSVT